MLVEVIALWLQRAAADVVKFSNENPWVLIALFLYVFGTIQYAAGRSGANIFLNIRTELAKSPIDALKAIFASVGNALSSEDPAQSTSFASPGQITGSVRALAIASSRVLDSAARIVESHLRNTLRLFSGDPNYLTWRFAGAILAGTLLCVFVLADAVQGLEALVGPYPSLERTIVTILPSGALPFSFVVASIGTIFTLSMILIDIAGITHFVPWVPSGASNRFTRNAFKVVAWFAASAALILAVFCALGVAVSRVSALPVAKIDDGDLLNISNWAAISLSLVVLPMYVATTLLFWGVMGVVAFYCILVWLVASSLRMSWAVSRVVRLILHALDPATTLLTKVYVAGLAVTFGVLGLIYGLVLVIADRLTETVELAVDQFVSVIRWLLMTPSKIRDWLWNGFTGLVNGLMSVIPPAARKILGFALALLVVVGIILISYLVILRLISLS